MSRYDYHNYRDHFACFDCRKSFKYWQWEECSERTWQRKAKLRHIPRTILCPDCGKPMVDMGLDFKSPRQSDIEQWKVLDALSREGFTFHGCGWLVGFRPPKRLRHVPAFLRAHKKTTNGEMLLRGIAEKKKKV